MTAIPTPAPTLLGGQPGVLIGGDWINTPSTRPVVLRRGLRRNLGYRRRVHRRAGGHR